MTHPQQNNNIKNAPPILLSALAITCALILSGCNGSGSTTAAATTTGTGTAAVATATASAAPAKISVVTAN